MYLRASVIPGAKKEKVITLGKDRLEIHVREKAEQNMANRRVKEILSLRFGVTAKEVRLVSGHRSPRKIFSIDVDGEVV